MGAASTIMAADVAKIGVFNYQKFLANSKAGQKVRALLNIKKKQFEKKLSAKRDEIQNISKELDRESMVMSPEKQKDKMRAQRIKINDFKDMEKRFTQELKKIEYLETKKIYKEVVGIIEKLGKKANYLLIVNEKAVLYSPSQIDLTDKIIKVHNKKFSSNG